MFEVVLQKDMVATSLQLEPSSVFGTTPPIIFRGVGMLKIKRAAEEEVEKILPEPPYAMFDSNITSTRTMMFDAWLRRSAPPL